MQAGFPALHLAPVDFVSLYTQQQGAQKTPAADPVNIESPVNGTTKWTHLTEST